MPFSPYDESPGSSLLQQLSQTFKNNVTVELVVGIMQSLISDVFPTFEVTIGVLTRYDLLVAVCINVPLCRTRCLGTQGSHRLYLPLLPVNSQFLQ